MHIRSQALAVVVVLFVLAVVLLWPVKRPASHCPKPAGGCRTSVQSKGGDDDVPLAYWIVITSSAEEEAVQEEETPSDTDVDAGDAGDGGGD
jgi:hypothetical protein